MTNTTLPTETDLARGRIEFVKFIATATPRELQALSARCRHHAGLDQLADALDAAAEAQLATVPA
jgi:hypothetical protein